jgi:hypothetical protein
MKIVAYKLTRNALWSVTTATVLLAIVSRFCVVEFYSSPPFGGSIQVYVDQGGWVTWATPESLFGNWMQASQSAYTTDLPSSLIDHYPNDLPNTEWAFSKAGMYFRPYSGNPATIRLGARHFVVITTAFIFSWLFHMIGSAALRRRRARSSVQVSDVDN